MVRPIIIIRHPPIAYHGKPKFIGQLDPPLSEAGLLLAEKVADALRNQSIAGIVSSDLQRASHTSQLIANACNKPLYLDKGLREEHLGCWQGQTHDSVQAVHTHSYNRWQKGNSRPCLCREGLYSVALRARPVLEQHLNNLNKSGLQGCLVVVSHVNTIVAMHGSCLGIGRRKWRSIGTINHGHGVLLCALNQGFRSLLYNWPIDDIALFLRRQSKKELGAL